MKGVLDRLLAVQAWAERPGGRRADPATQFIGEDGGVGDTQVPSPSSQGQLCLPIPGRTTDTKNHPLFQKLADPFPPLGRKQPSHLALSSRVGPQGQRSP